jgi:hypothetical protein
MLGRLHYNLWQPPAPLEPPQTRLMVSIIAVSDSFDTATSAAPDACEPAALVRGC